MHCINASSSGRRAKSVCNDSMLLFSKSFPLNIYPLISLYNEGLLDEAVTVYRNLYGRSEAETV